MVARIALIAALALPALTDAAQVSLEQLTAAYGLNENYKFQFPGQSLAAGDSSSNWIIKNWNTNGDHIQWGTNDITFSADPATSNGKRAESTKTHSSAGSSTSAVAPASSGTAGNSTQDSTALRIEYPQGSYNNMTGGTQFYAQPFNATSKSSSPFSNITSSGQFERMLLSYDIFFPTGFQFNLGGKLPGLRGGPDPSRCSGGHQANGKDCFSTRLMWRQGALGEVYTYLPPHPKGFCSQQWVTCNKDYGTSIGRGTISFKTGTWQTVWLYVELNQVGWRNGLIALYYNGVKAVEINQLEIRRSDSISSIGGLYFSTFFGGDTADWASPATQDSYFRNIQLYGGLGASNATGPRSGASAAVAAPSLVLVTLAIGSVLVLALA